jgi:hypothetical protein
VRRVASLYIDPACAALEHNRYRYDPSGLIGFVWFLLGTSYMFMGWTHYKALSNDIENKYGSLELNETMSLLRDEYSGNTDIFMKFIRTFHYDLECLCPETGEMVISFARDNTLACYNQVYYFNVNELFNATPP